MLYQSITNYYFSNSKTDEKWPKSIVQLTSFRQQTTVAIFWSHCATDSAFMATGHFCGGSSDGLELFPDNFLDPDIGTVAWTLTEDVFIIEIVVRLVQQSATAIHPRHWQLTCFLGFIWHWNQTAPFTSIISSRAVAYTASQSNAKLLQGRWWHSYSNTITVSLVFCIIFLISSIRPYYAHKPAVFHFF